MRQAADIKDLTQKKLSNQGKTEELEEKIKSLIEEIENKSKKYLKEISQIHESYRGIQNSSAEAESRIQMYKSDWEKATQAERLAKKDVLRLQFSNDELNERHKYMERKYLQLVQRVGASQEDLEAVEVIMASGTGEKNLPNLKPVKQNCSLFENFHKKLYF